MQATQYLFQYHISDTWNFHYRIALQRPGQGDPGDGLEDRRSAREGMVAHGSILLLWTHNPHHLIAKRQQASSRSRIRAAERPEGPAIAKEGFC